MRDLIKDTLLRDIKRRIKAQHPVGIEATTSRVLLCRHVLYRCATTAALTPIEKKSLLRDYNGRIFSDIGGLNQDDIIS